MSFHTTEMEMEKFDQVFTDALNSLMNDFVKPTGELKTVILRLKEMLDYNVPGEKKTRGLFVVNAYKTFCGENDINEDNIYSVYMLGWCVEMLQACLRMSEDIVDRVVTRRGRLCWYKREDVGLMAINDAFSIEACIFFLLKKYFHHKPYYKNIIELFHEVSFRIFVGQSLDLLTSSSVELDFDKFTLETYKTIIQHKTTYYSFYLPIALALYVAEISDPNVHNKAKKVLIEIGNLFQVQDDYVDCYGDPDVVRRIGTDIEDGKCTWLVVTAFKLGGPEEVAAIRENYGKNDSQCVAKVKNVYEKLEIAAVFKKYEEKQNKRIMELIDQLEPNIPSDVFRQLAHYMQERER